MSLLEGKRKTKAKVASLLVALSSHATPRMASDARFSASDASREIGKMLRSVAHMEKKTRILSVEHIYSIPYISLFSYIKNKNMWINIACADYVSV